MAATPPAPSTVADSPIDEALAKLMGTKGPLSKTTGTNPIGYDPNQTFRPTGDTLNISNLGGSGVSTPEQWTHEIQLANLAQQSAQQEYTKQAAAQEFAYKTAQDVLANQRSAAQLAMQQAEARRAGALGPAQLEAANLANQQARQTLQTSAYDTALKRAQADVAAAQAFTQLGGMTLPQLQNLLNTQQRFQAFSQGQPVGSPGLSEQFKAYYNSPQYNQVAQPVWNANAQTWMAPATPTYNSGMNYSTGVPVNRVYNTLGLK